jgi:putative transposase
MANPPRYLPGGVPAHVILRGHNRGVVFGESAECELFLVFLRKSAERHGVLLHAFAIMSTHAHLIVTPSAVDSIAKMIQSVGARYARFFNTRHQRSGAVWEGRYRAHIIDTDRYFFTCLRYVERNPVDAGIVAHPDEYRWSSYGAHALDVWPSWLTPHPLYLALGRTGCDRAAHYRALCNEPLSDGEAAWVRYVIERDWPDGVLAFQHGANRIDQPAE